MTLDYQIPYKDDELTVTFEAYPKMIDDSYDDEFGTVEIKPYPSLEESDGFTWEPQEYTCEENKAIANFINDPKQLLKLEDYFCKEYANQLNDFEP